MGVDIDKRFAKTYAQYNDARLEFFKMSDVSFPQYYRSRSEFNNKKADIIFIDTSHIYDHTVAEIKAFLPMLNDKGMFLFHDTNMSPLTEYKWKCINGDLCGRGWNNKKGVIRGIRDCFGISIDETKYINRKFTKDGITWKLIHYPFCNGLTLLKKLGS